MNYQEVLDQSRAHMGNWCKSCPTCNGKACGSHIPGPGAKGSGTVAAANYDAWQKRHVIMDTLCENKSADTTAILFGREFKYPIFAGPVGAVGMHYSDLYNDQSYNDVLVEGCAQAGIAAFTGDGMNPNIMEYACDAISRQQGTGVPTIKPWDTETFQEKLDLAAKSGSFAVACDIDAAGLPFLKKSPKPAGRKTTAELREIINKAPAPFIVKGIMSVKGALKALAAGADAIVVSNHGGRVQDGTEATADVLEEIVDAVDGRMTILVDGGIRSGVDIFKALAMGADGVLIARPYVNAVYGGAQEGVRLLTEKLGNELKDTMEMCGASCLQEITRGMIR